MATKKTTAAAKKSTTTKKSAPVAKKTTTKVTTVAAAAPRKRSSESVLNTNLVNIVVAEIVGTFVLTAVAMLTVADILPLFVGLTMAVLVLIVGAVSGAHVNPAVTFGLWAARRLNSMLLPFYWVAQFVGAMGAVLLTGWVAGKQTGLDFGHFGTFSWSIFAIELIGTAVFLFGVTTVTARAELSNTGKALGVGLSLFVGLLVAASFQAPVRQAAIANYQKEASATGKAPEEIPHSIYVKGATLNPAIALASTESTQSELNGSAATDEEKHYTRLGWETILSTLIGAALGANLALLVAYRFRS